ncbi:hypothetical protein [Pragia fontium]|uniref:hypothetical protein n=1 Tax=Pragia fontium TaxID=82985 RepID=UPI000F7137E2|nr:hypothetical protein [Pragia fontium]VEJ56599.1 Uncharacterised protein [Pragia fontium]
MKKISSFLLLCLCFVMLAGCRIQTTYKNGSVSGIVKDVITQQPIADALVVIEYLAITVKMTTDQQGHFHMDEKTGWEIVGMMDGRAPQDFQWPGFITITAKGYQTRSWLADYHIVYDYPIQLLPENSSLSYVKMELPNGQTLYYQLDSEHSPPQPPETEVFVEAG